MFPAFSGEEYDRPMTLGWGRSCVAQLYADQITLSHCAMCGCGDRAQYYYGEAILFGWWDGHKHKWGNKEGGVQLQIKFNEMEMYE